MEIKEKISFEAREIIKMKIEKAGGNEGIF